MSRSYRKTPKAYVCSDNARLMKQFKRATNKVFRRKVKIALYNEEYGREAVYPKKVIEADDLWSSPADGNQSWFGELRHIKKYEDYYKKRMRK